MSGHPMPPRCHGAGEVTQVETPWLHPSDPAHATSTFPCQGCVDCLTGQALTVGDVEHLDSRPELVVIELRSDGCIVIAGEAGGKDLGVFALHDA